MSRFDLQGHRGARGLKPENTLPSFEVALDAGVSTIETDVHLTRDGVPVLYHDATLSELLCRPIPGRPVPDPATRPLISSLTLVELRGYLADMNPDPARFPKQDYIVPPLTELYAQRYGYNPYWIPTLTDLFAFVAAYGDRLGEHAEKTDAQREKAQRVCLELELKRVPFRPEFIGDKFDGKSPDLLEQQVVKQVKTAKLVERTRVRSFDHRCIRAFQRLEPKLATSALIAGTAPVAPGQLARLANAQAYCPDFESLDLRQVKQCHNEGVRVIPWTVNEPAVWQRLLEWGVDGITTDYPNQLALFLDERHIEY